MIFRVMSETRELYVVHIPQEEERIFLESQKRGSTQFIQIDDPSTLPVIEEIINSECSSEIFYKLDEYDNIVIDEDRTWNEYIRKATEYLNLLRTNEIERLVVTVTINDQDISFDADETSQSRISRTLMKMSDTDEIEWITADNTTVTLSKQDLQNVFNACIDMHCNVWLSYYNLKQKVRERKTIEQAREELGL